MIFLNQNDHSNPIHLSFLFYYQRYIIKVKW